MKLCRRFRIVALGIVVLGGLAVAPADAATVSLELGTLTYRAGPGEVNQPTFGVQVRGGRARDVFVSDSPGVRAGAGCSVSRRPPLDVVECPLPPNITSVPLNAALGDGNDVVAALPSVIDVAEIDGGPGNDVIRGSAGEDRLTGGPGDDELFGFARDDTFVSASLDGADTMHGGTGIGDEVDYSGREAPLRIDLDGRRDDGQRRESDRIDTDVEDLTGGSAGDRITSFRQPSTMAGGPGNDVMRGGPSTDELFGNSGRDRISAGSGSDKIEGGRGDDRMSGGGGSDLLRGEDGDDRIRSRDARSDRVGCGRGRDRIVLDKFDMAFPSCERVSRTGPAVVVPLGVEGLPEGFSLFASEVQGLEVEISLGCPRDDPHGCTGSFQLVRRGRTVASRGFSIRTGGQKTYTARVPASIARTVRRRGRLNARLLVFSRDPRGRFRLNGPFTLFETLPTLD